MRVLDLTVLRLIGSGKLALISILLFMLFAMAGAMLPQEGQMPAAEIARWQVEHDWTTRLASPLGLFHVFSCWPFLITLLVLAVNTLASVVRRFYIQGGWAALRGPRAVERIGFHLLHVSLILLLAGGFWTAAADLDGKILLTEGQVFTDAHDQFLELHEGPLRREQHSGISVRLADIDIQYAKQRYQVAAKSTLDVLADGAKVGGGEVEVNRPFTHAGLSFTHDANGFSPRLIVRGASGRRLLLDAFIALQTEKTATGYLYRDVIPLPLPGRRVVATLYPSFERVGDKVRKASDVVDNPLLVLSVWDEQGSVVEEKQVALGGRTRIGKYGFEFADLRRWVSYRVTHDPGYPLVCAAFVLGLFALILRYYDDLRQWVEELTGSVAVDEPARRTDRSAPQAMESEAAPK